MALQIGLDGRLDSDVLQSLSRLVDGCISGIAERFSVATAKDEDIKWCESSFAVSTAAVAQEYVLDLISIVE